MISRKISPLLLTASRLDRRESIHPRNMSSKVVASIAMHTASVSIHNVSMLRESSRRSKICREYTGRARSSTLIDKLVVAISHNPWRADTMNWLRGLKMGERRWLCGARQGSRRFPRDAYPDGS